MHDWGVVSCLVRILQINKLKRPATTATEQERAGRLDWTRLFTDERREKAWLQTSRGRGAASLKSPLDDADRICR